MTNGCEGATRSRDFALRLEVANNDTVLGGRRARIPAAGPSGREAGPCSRRRGPALDAASISLRK